MKGTIVTLEDFRFTVMTILLVFQFYLSCITSPIDPGRGGRGSQPGIQTEYSTYKSVLERLKMCERKGMHSGKKIIGSIMKIQRLIEHSQSQNFCPNLTFPCFCNHQILLELSLLTSTCFLD